MRVCAMIILIAIWIFAFSNARQRTMMQLDNLAPKCRDEDLPQHLHVYCNTISSKLLDFLLLLHCRRLNKTYTMHIVNKLVTPFSKYLIQALLLMALRLDLPLDSLTQSR